MVQDGLTGTETRSNGEGQERVKDTRPVCLTLKKVQSTCVTQDRMRPGRVSYKSNRSRERSVGKRRITDE